MGAKNSSFSNGNGACFYKQIVFRGYFKKKSLKENNLEDLQGKEMNQISDVETSEHK